MKYIITVKLKDVCENIVKIILDSEIKDYKLNYGTYIINLFKEFKIFEKNIVKVDYQNKVGMLNFDTINDGGGDYISSSNTISFEFDTEEELFYFRLKNNAEILKIEEKTTNEY